MKRLWTWVSAGAQRSLLLTFLASAHAAAPPTFEKDIRPIFKAHCFDCHGEGDQKRADSMCGNAG